MMSQQSSQQSRGNELLHQSQGSQNTSNQLREEPELMVNSSAIKPGPRKVKELQQKVPSQLRQPTSTSQLLQQQANMQGGSADMGQHDEMSSAIEQIRQRHQKDLQLEQQLQAQSQSRQLQVQQQKSQNQQQQQQSPVELVKDVTEAENTTEFLLLSLQRCFVLKPQQVQQLLQNQNQLLIQACEQGLPINDYTKVQHWFEFLSQDTIFKKMINQFLKALSSNQEIDVILVLGAIKCGLYSRDEITAKLCMKLLFNIIEFLRKGNEEYIKRGKSMPIVFDTSFAKWFTKHVPQPEDSFLHNSVLQSVAECLEQHHSLVKEAANLYHSVFKSTLFKLSQLPGLLKEAYSDDIFMMYETMSTLLGDLNKLDRDAMKAATEESTLLQDVLIDSTANHGDFALKLKCTNLLIEIWFLYPTIVSMPSRQNIGVGSLSLKESFHYILQQGTQERDKVFRINVFANGFTILDRLATKDNSETSAVYSTLISGLLEHYKGKTSDKQIDQVSTEMILRGFRTVFREHDDVPKHVMMDPFLEQLIINLKQHKSGENLMTTMELEFLTDVIRDHGQVLQEDTALLLLEYFHAVQQSRPYLTHAMKLSDHIGALVYEHKERSMGIMRYVQQTIVPQTLSQLLAIKREEISHATQNPLSSHNAKKGRSPKKGSKGHKLLLAKDKELAADRRLKRFNIISLMDKLHEVMQGVKNQDNLVDSVRASMSRYIETFQSTSTGLQHLMEKWDVEIDSFRNRQSLVPALYNSETDEASKRIVALATDNLSAEEMSQRMEQKKKKKELEWSKVKDPQNPIALRAVEEFQALKQKRIEKQNKERLEEAKKMQKQERMKSQAKLEVVQRGMILERDSIMRQQKLKAIFSGGQESAPLDKDFQSLPMTSSVLAQQLRPTRSTSLAQLKYPSASKETTVALISSQSASVGITTKKKNILVEFDGTEEDREKDSVRLVLQKYTTLFRFLFDKYTAKTDIFKKQNARNRTLSEKVITIADLMKMYREHNMDHSMLNKHEFQLLMQQINSKLLKPYDDDALGFAGFVQFFWQSAIYCHHQSKFKAPHETGGKAIKSLLFGEMIQNLVTWFKVAAQSRGHQTVLYDYPELAREPSRAKQLQQLNEKVQKNPNLALPSGFVLSKEMHQVKEYGIPPSARKTIGESKAMALEILDELLAQSIGLRLFEPQISIKETQVVKVATQHGAGESSNRSGASSSLHQSDSSRFPPPAYSNGTPQIFGTNKLSTKSDINGNSVMSKKGSIRSLAQISTVQTILQNQSYDDSDIYGLGVSSSDKEYQSEQTRQQFASLNIYKTDSILRVKESNSMRRIGLHDNVQLSRHRAHQLASISLSTKNRSLTQVRLPSDLTASKRKAGRATRLNENLLLQTEMSADLKAATYEYQLSKTDERDLEPIRQTALVIEDMLQALSGDLPKYPYEPKKVVKPLKALQDKQRAQSIISQKNKSLQIKQRIQPGEYKSNLDKQRLQEMQRQEHQKQSDIQKDEMARIKRSFMLKKKLAEQNDANQIPNSRARSEKAYSGMKGILESNEKNEDRMSSGLDNLIIVDPRDGQLDKKKIAQLRAKQLKLSQAEREAKKKKHTEDGLAILAQEKAEKQRAALEAKHRIEQSMVRRQEYSELEQCLIKKTTDDLAAKQKQRSRINISSSVERLAKPAFLKVQAPPSPSKQANKKVKSSAVSSLSKQKKQKDSMARQKMNVYIKKERQEVLAFYLRPDVQTVVAEYDQQLGRLYEKIVGARDSLDRDTKRMNAEGYVRGFGETADIVPATLSIRDLGLIFDTIVNERVDNSQHDSFDNPTLAQVAGSLSFEEFKKSMVRVASLCFVSSQKIRISPHEIVDEQDRLLDTTGGEAPAEWDEHGNPIKYKTVITLKKLPTQPIELTVQGRISKEQPPKMYEISKLKLEKFHKVLHYIVNHTKDKQPRYTQPIVDIGSSALTSPARNFGSEPMIQIQQQSDELHTFGVRALEDSRGHQDQLATMKEALEEAEDTMMSGQHMPVRDDLSDDDEDDELFRENQQKNLAASQGYDLTLGENQIMRAAAIDHDELLDNTGGLIGSGRNGNQNNNNQLKNSLVSSRRQESDGQFSEYNEVLKSPLVDGSLGNPKLRQGLNSGSVDMLEGASPRLGESIKKEQNNNGGNRGGQDLRQAIQADDDDIQDEYD